MKYVSKKQILVIIPVILALSIVAIFAFKYQSGQKDEPAVEVSVRNTTTELEPTEEDVLDPGDPVVEMKDGKFEFLSGGYENYGEVNGGVQDRISVYLTLDSSDVVYYTHDWQLDSYDTSANKKIVVYSTFHTQAKVYRVYRYVVDSGTNTLLREFDISDSAIFTAGHVHLPFSLLELSPDAEHYYLISYSFDRKNYIGLEYRSFVQATDGGDLVELEIPEDIYQQYWFSNSEVAFSGADFGGSGYDGDYVQIYNIYTGLVSPTKIPVRGAMSGLSPKINPAATAYAYYDVTENHGYACGGSIMDLVVISYSNGEELFRLEDLHKLEYRWLANNQLEIIFTRIPQVEGEYTPKSKTDQETLDAIVCSEQEMIYFEAP